MIREVERLERVVADLERDPVGGREAALKEARTELEQARGRLQEERDLQSEIDDFGALF